MVAKIHRQGFPHSQLSFLRWVYPSIQTLQYALALHAVPLRELQDLNWQLQGKTAQLEQILRQKELEIERLQQQVESKKSSGSSESSGDVCDNLALGEDNTEACASQVHYPHQVPLSVLLVIHQSAQGQGCGQTSTNAELNKLGCKWHCVCV